MKRRYIHELGVVLIVCGGLVSSIVYANIQTYDPVLTPAQGYSDSSDYIALYYGDPVMGHRGYRPFVPWLARAVPDLPSGIFSSERQVTDVLQVGIKFGVVNATFLLGTCLALYAFQRAVGFDFWTGLLGTVLFLSARPVVRAAGLPMTDAGLYLFLMFGFLAASQGWAGQLAVAGVLGVLTNELTLLLFPAVLLLPFTWRVRARLVLALVPAILVRVYIPFFTRFLIGTDMNGIGMIVDVVRPVTHPFRGDVFVEALRYLSTPSGWLAIFFAFGLAWVPAVYALWRTQIPVLLRRWIWLMPLIALGILLATGSAANMSRLLFLGFPVVMPLAARGVAHFLRETGSSA